MYKLTGENWVLRVVDQARIPLIDEPLEPNTNPHYLEYKQWLAEGNVPEPVDPALSKRPSEITARLTQIDAESVRPLRAKVAGTATADDDDKLNALDAEAKSLRLELSALK